jgi:PAS domain S-box-containing protein
MDTKSPQRQEIPNLTDGLLELQATALEVAANPIVISRRDGTIIWVNKAFEGLSGYGREEALGQNTRLLNSGNQPPSFYKSMWKTILSGQIWRGELVNRRKDRSLYPEEMTITPVLNRAGEITHFIAIKLDITERKRSEEKLRASETYYRSIFEGAFDAVTVAGVQGRFEYVNAAACRVFGYSRDELMSMKITDILAPKELPRLKRFLNSLTVGELVYGEWLSRRNDGSTFSSEVGVSKMPNGRTLGIGRDITERKLAEEELRASEERFRLFIKNAPVALAMFDCEMRYLHASLRWRVDYGLGDRDLRGVSHYEVFPEMPEQWKEAHRRGLAGEVLHGDNNRFERTNGAVQWIRWGIHPWRDGTGHVGGIVIFTEDITESRQLEAQLRQSQKMEAIGSLAAGVAHDFNNGLGVILGNMELLVERIPPDEICQKYLDRVRIAVNSATSVTRQLLAFSRKQVMQPVILNLNQCVERLSKMTQRLIGENIMVTLSLENCLGQVMADPGQIDQVLLNLVVNARDAMQQGGQLFIQTANVEFDQEFVSQHLGAAPGQYVRLTVKDTGTGMGKEVLAHMFEPFFSTKEVGKGTGLGLATVYGIVKQSGGYIWVESEPGAGATFQICLPRVDGKPAFEEPAKTASFAFGSETVLLVEDEQLLREVIRVQLEKLGYRVHEAIDAERAMALFDEHRGEIGLLLTDVIMPGMNGRTLGNKLRERKSDLGVLYMSGYTDDEILKQGISEDGQAILIKPFSSEKLASGVREALARIPRSANGR